jgi:hypothetical protein
MQHEVLHCYVCKGTIITNFDKTRDSCQLAAATLASVEVWVFSRKALTLHDKGGLIE